MSKIKVIHINDPSIMNHNEYKFKKEWAGCVVTNKADRTDSYFAYIVGAKNERAHRITRETFQEFFTNPDYTEHLYPVSESEKRTLVDLIRRCTPDEKQRLHDKFFSENCPNNKVEDLPPSPFAFRITAIGCCCITLIKGVPASDDLGERIVKDEYVDLLHISNHGEEGSTLTLEVNNKYDSRDFPPFFKNSIEFSDLHSVKGPDKYSISDISRKLERDIGIRIETSHNRYVELFEVHR